MFSPLSLGLVLLMARFGARGRTASQIETALKLPYPTENEDDLVPYRLGYARILQRIKVRLRRIEKKIFVFCLNFCVVPLRGLQGDRGN